MEEINSTFIHPLDVLTEFVTELETGGQLTYEQGLLRADAIQWIITHCNDVSQALAMVRDADHVLDNSTDLAARLKAQSDKKRIYDVIDRSSEVSQ